MPNSNVYLTNTCSALDISPGINLFYLGFFFSLMAAQVHLNSKFAFYLKCSQSS